jgi:hypothetical protein
MYLLDTNVISDLRRPSRITPGAAQWFGTVASARLFVSTVTLFEIQHGIVRLRKRDMGRAAHLQRWFETAILTAFVGRIIPFGTQAAMHGAALHSGRVRIDPDRLIAATALAAGMTVVTRNPKDFSGLGVPTFDPF